jgi:hypothetical protein
MVCVEMSQWNPFVQLTYASKNHICTAYEKENMDNRLFGMLSKRPAEGIEPLHCKWKTGQHWKNSWGNYVRHMENKCKMVQVNSFLSVIEDKLE